MEQQIVVFELAGEQYGVEIAAVESILKPQPLTRLPRTPHFVEGVTNLRGRVLPVIDLRRRLGLPAGETGPQTRLIVVSLGGALIGLVVDGVSEVLSLPEGVVEPPSPLVTSLDTAFIQGIAKLPGRLIILVDLRKVLTIEEQVELRQE